MAVVASVEREDPTALLTTRSRPRETSQVPMRRRSRSRHRSPQRSASESEWTDDEGSGKLGTSDAMPAEKKDGAVCK